MSEELLEELKARLDNLLAVAEKSKIRRDVRETEKTKHLLTITGKQQENTVLLQVMELFKSLGGVHERELLDKLEVFVTYGLQIVFGASYSFVTELSREGKDLRVDFYVKTGDLQSSVVGAKGGGVAEVVSLLLQLFFVIALKGTLAPFLLLDTAMINLSKCFHGRMSTLLKELCDKLGIQVLLLAHSGEYGKYADCLYHLEQKEGKSIVERVK